MTTAAIALGGASIPPLIALLSKFFFEERDSGHARKIKQVARLADAVPEAHRQPLLNLLDIRIERYTRRSSRKLDGSTVSLMIVLSIVTALLAWGGILLAINVQPWIFGILTALVTLFGVLLISVGGGSNLYTDPDAPQPPSRAARR